MATKERLDQAEVRAGEVKSATKVKADRAVAETETGIHAVSDSIRNGPGTVDAARGVVRDALSKGIEKGKEAVGKATAAVGLTAAKIDSKAQSAGLHYSSAVEKALQERYEKPNGMNKSVEEALEERYKPIDHRDNTLLRGV